MKNKLEILNTIAVKRGYSTWGAAIYDLSDKEVLEMTFEAMDEYAQTAQLQQHVVGGPASASALEGEQLGNEAGEKGVWVEGACSCCGETLTVHTHCKYCDNDE